MMSEELHHISDTMEELLERARQEEIQQPLKSLKQAAEQVGKAWSDSWIGYHANVYYRDFRIPPPGAHFNKSWGLKKPTFDSGSTGEWVEYTAEYVEAAIYQRAGCTSMQSVRAFADEASARFSRQQRTLLSIIELELLGSVSPFLTGLKEETENLTVVNGNRVLQSWKPGYNLTIHDEIAAHQGTQAPPHLVVLSEVCAIQHTISIVGSLTDITKQVESHLSRQQLRQQSSSVGTRVFIGHGHSQVWRELKDFLEDRLGLLVDEYNRVSTAGITTTSRLSAMMDSAGIAFLVMTAEDEQADGNTRARANVVHEVGLFQGRLGFERTIVLLEEGCEEFSNIVGLGQIRFPKDNIRAAFEKIRMALEREGFILPGQ